MADCILKETINDLDALLEVVVPKCDELKECDIGKAIGNLRGLKTKKDKKAWGYEATTIQLVLQAPKNCRPTISGELFVTLDFSINVSIDENQSLEVNSLNLNILFEQTPYKTCWHLDKHSQSFDYQHPLFHWQHGGHKLKPLDSGQLLCMPAPRIMFPPLDLILALDFIFSNFLKDEAYKKLRENADYKRIVERSQKRYWTSYFQTLSCGISSLSQDPAASSLCPTLF